MSCPSALIGHPEGSANGFPLKDRGNDREGLSFLQAAKLLQRFKLFPVLKKIPSE
jgi:hypothetical protein